MASVEVVAKNVKLITALSFDAEGHLFVGSRAGHVYNEEEGVLLEEARLSGCITGICADGDGVLCIAEQGGRSLTLLSADDRSPQLLVREYEGERLLGPHGVALSSDGKIFFSDPGPAGETSIVSPRGSVYRISDHGGGSRVLIPLIHGKLARPTGIALDPTETLLYVCEQSANRILRLHQKPRGVWHAVVFAQFAGRLGPSAVVCDASRGGILYVARPELPEQSSESVITVLGPDGAILKELEVPGPEITSLALSPSPSQGEPSTYLVYACSHTNSIYKVLL